ncbi:predicted protein [Naegleria gruberi]|uniref:Arp2/3 complex 34 kDa subunit n=1 Tax=Naegleria gruberi TaxID=5762 RepID=D2VYC6_NAEGR|nr:uncharacterized protein NAEGRDRAFT_81704 [Naegleria gruberi]EFC38183.1 predicted protein [Naegleria gruberi]|eukprot:XP_002670927.1 predicted protein [Naegleria gruberi strain NEG-M]
MIFLEAGNKIIQEILLKQFDASTRQPSVHVNGGDFDGTKFVIQSDAGNKNLLTLSIYVHGEKEFNQYGGIELVKKTLPGLDVKAPGLTVDDQKHTFTVTIDVEKEEKNKDKWLKELPRVKTTYMSAVFLQAMDKHAKGEQFEPIKVPYRPDENIYIISYKGKSLVVVYSILFRDPDDVVFANGFLCEFKDAKKDRALNAAPNMNFSQGQLAGELVDVKSVTEPKDERTLKKEGWGFVSIGLLDNHTKADKQLNTAELLLGFRSYLHYHLKCMKAYMHIRMRESVEKLMLNLNAAKDLSGKKTEKKTMSGRTFKQQ